MSNMLDLLGAPQEEREILHRHLFDRGERSLDRTEKTPEQRRQVVRRTMRNCAKALVA